MNWKELSEEVKKGCSRRTFMKGTATAAAAVTLAGCSDDDDEDDYVPGKSGNAPDLRTVRKVYSTCPVECLTHSLNCQLVGDEVVRVEPTRKDNDIYFTTACARGMSRMQFLTENRALTPMKRIKKGTKTSKLGVVLKDNSVDQWVSISWQQAISELGAKLKELKEAGETGIMTWTGSGNMGPIVNNLIGNFFNHINPNRTAKLGNSCCAGVDAGMTPVYGVRSIDTRDTIRYSKCIINWGNNPAETSNTYWKYVVDAKLAGAKVITIDPRYCGSAEKSDIWVQIMPGTDVLFGIGIMRHIFANDLSNDGANEWLDIETIKHRSDAAYLIDISAITDGAGNLKPKAYNELYKVTYKDGKPQVYNDLTGAIEDAEKNNGEGAAQFQDPNIYYTDMVNNVTTAYQLMRALYAGDLLTAGDGAVDPALAALHDPNYVDSYIEKVTGTTMDLVEQVAEAYANSGKKSMIIQNMGGGQRVESAGHECALQCILSVITGNVGGLGNGVDDTSGWGSAASGLQSGDIKAPGTSMRLNTKFKVEGTHDIPFGILGRRALAAANGEPYDTWIKKPNNADKDPFIKFWWIASSNLLTQFPNTDMLKEALNAAECVVTVKPTWNTDADFADYFLPVTTPFEYADIGAHNRNKYIQVMEAGVKPYGQAVTDRWILHELAKIVFDDPEIIENFAHDDEWYPREIIENPANNMAENGIPNFEYLKEHKTIRPKAYPLPFIPLHKKEFKTAEGLARAHMFVSDWNTDGGKVKNCKTNIDRSPNPARDLFRGPFPRHVPALQSKMPFLDDFPYAGPGSMPNAAKDMDVDYQDIRNKYPLCNLQFKVLRTVHASFTGLPWIREAFGEKGIVLIHPEDALERGISDGDLVTVRSWSGAVERYAKVSNFIMKGVTGIENGWWDKYGKVTSSTVGVELPGALNNAHTHNNTLVEITKGGMK